MSLVGAEGRQRGRAPLQLDSIIDAIEYADDEDIPIVNGSYIGAGSDDPPDAERIAYENAEDTLFVVAAGNAAIDVDNTAGTAAFPCAYTLPNILCVAATTPSDGLASFSNFGDTNVDVGAPGHQRAQHRAEVRDPGLRGRLRGHRPWTSGSSRRATGSTTPRRPNLGARALTDSPGGNYANNENSSIRMKDPIDLTGSESCRLQHRLGLHPRRRATRCEVEFTTDSDPGPTVHLGAALRPRDPVHRHRGLRLPQPRHGPDRRDGAGERPHQVPARRPTAPAPPTASTSTTSRSSASTPPRPARSAPTGSARAPRWPRPQVAGVAALVLSADPGQDLTVEQLRNTLLVLGRSARLAEVQDDDGRPDQRGDRARDQPAPRAHRRRRTAPSPAPPPSETPIVHPADRTPAGGEAEAEVQEAEEGGRRPRARRQRPRRSASSKKKR